jgi:hypothetical protein
MSISITAEIPGGSIDVVDVSDPDSLKLQLPAAILASLLRLRG